MPPLVDLPDELILQIITHLDLPDILPLSRVSRRLQLIALPLYLEHWGIKPDQHGHIHELVLDFIRDPVSAMSRAEGIQTAFFITSIHHLHCIFHTGDTFVDKEAPSVVGLMKGCTTISRVTFVSYFERRYSGSSLYGLLETAKSRACKDLKVVDKSAGNSPHGCSFGFPKIRRQKPWQKLLQRLGKSPPHTPLLPLAIGRLELQSGLIAANSYKPISPILGSMTTLSLVCHYSSDSYSVFFETATMPNLVEFSFVGGVALRGFQSIMMAQFISRHPTIKILDHRTDWGHEHSPHYKTFPPLVFPALVKLIGRAPDIQHILNLSSSHPKLESIHIISRFRVHEWDYLKVDPMDGALSAISFLKGQIRLLLSFKEESVLEAWLHKQLERALVEPTMHCVHILEVSTEGQFQFSPSILGLLPRWLAMFPAIREASFADGSVTLDAKAAVSVSTFVGEIRRLSPGIKSLKFDMVEHISDTI